MVRFGSVHGEGEGVWMRAGGSPIVGETMSVEFDLDESFENNGAVAPSSLQEYRLSCADGLVCIVGKVEALDEDRVVYFRIGADCLFMLESEHPAFVAGHWLEIRTQRRFVQLW